MVSLYSVYSLASTRPQFTLLAWSFAKDYSFEHVIYSRAVLHYKQCRAGLSNVLECAKSDILLRCHTISFHHN